MFCPLSEKNGNLFWLHCLIRNIWKFAKNGRKKSSKSFSDLLLRVPLRGAGYSVVSELFIANIFPVLSELNIGQGYVQDKKHRRSILALAYHACRCIVEWVGRQEAYTKVVDFQLHPCMPKGTAAPDRFDDFGKHKILLWIRYLSLIHIWRCRRS